MLVEATLAGDRNAFGVLVEKYEKPLYNAGYRVTGSREDAMDVTQSAFVKAYEKLHSFNANHSFFSWIYRIAVNEALNLLQRRRRESDRPELENEILRQEKGPVELLAESETGRHVQAALMNLTPESRVVLVLRHFQGLSYREMAQVIGVAEKTVKSRLFTARQKLKKILVEQGVM